MSFRDNKKPAEFPEILPFPVENPQLRLSIKIDDANVGDLYMKYYSMVYTRCLFILKNMENAQDVAHDVFKKIQELKTQGRTTEINPKKYLSKMAKHNSLNKKKRARRELIEVYTRATNGSIEWFKTNAKQEQDKWEIGITDNGYDEIEAKIIINAILDEQDETTRNIYIYRYRDNMTLKEIGEVVGLKKSAIQKRIKKLEEQVRVKTGRVDK
jgi:RNA polymerase sigma-70 factor (ECF subfamily)